jgi:hypothetical protein
VFTTSGTYPWSFVTQIFHNGQPSHGGDRKIFKVMTSTLLFPIVNFPFICSNIPAAPAYGVYISQMIRYSRACGSYQDFRDRGLLLTMKLLNQGFLSLTPLKTGGEHRCSGRLISSCSTSGTDTRRVNLVTSPVINRECGKNREVLTTSGTYPWSFVTDIP